MAPAEIELENTARLLDPERPHTIVVAGGGHAAHVLLGLLGSNPLYTVKLWDSRAHHLPTWRAQLGASGGTVAVTNEGASGDGSGPIEGRVAAVSDDPADVVPGADMIIIAAPAFAHEAYLKGSAPFVTDSTVVGTMVAAGGFEWALRDAYGDRVDRMVTFGMETLPWCAAARARARLRGSLGRARARPARAASLTDPRAPPLAPPHPRRAAQGVPAHRDGPLGLDPGHQGPHPRRGHAARLLRRRALLLELSAVGWRAAVVRARGGRVRVDDADERERVLPPGHHARPVRRLGRQHAVRAAAPLLSGRHAGARGRAARAAEVRSRAPRRARHTRTQRERERETRLSRWRRPG